MKKGILSKLLVVAVAGAMLFSVAGCGAKESTLDRVKKAGKVIVGTNAEYAPYEFHKLVDGKDTIIGFDIDIAKEVAKDLGVELQIQDMNFDGLLESLKTNKVDFVIAGMTPNEKRKKEVDFSKIYYVAKQGVLVRAEDKDKYKAIADLKGKKVGAQATTTQETIVKEQMKDSTLVSLVKVPDLVLELKNKKVDAVVMELPVAKGYVKNNSDLVVSSVAFAEDEGGSAIAVKKGNKAFIEQIDKTLDRLIKDGTIDKFVADATEKNEVKK